MPTPTEIIMAKMLVSGLALDRKEGLLDLLCEDDPSKVLHLLQLQLAKHKQDKLIGHQLQSISPVEVMQPTKRARTVAPDNEISVPLTTQAHDDTAEISGLAVTIDRSNSDSEEASDHGSDYEILDDAPDTSYQSDLESIDEEPSISARRATFHTYGCRSQCRVTMKYEDFNPLVRGRADRLYELDAQYRLEHTLEDRGLIKSHVMSSVFDMERAKVESGALSPEASLKSSGAFKHFFREYGYGTRIRYPSLGPWQANVCSDNSNPDPCSDYPAATIREKSARAKRGRVSTGSAK